MLTVDFDRLGVGPGDVALDLGCGAGRHTFELYRRGVDVVALDRDGDEVTTTAQWLGAIRAAGEAPAAAVAMPAVGDATRLPFPDGAFDVVVAAEILEHIPGDATAIAEITRVLRPGGRVAVTVPRWLPERVCWALSDAYHQVDGGHVRIYGRRELTAGLARAGLVVTDHEHAHGLHAPYWWLRCIVGVDVDDALPVRLYHRLLTWDIERRPLLTRAAERVLDPVIGKSLVLYATKPEAARAAA